VTSDANPFQLVTIVLIVFFSLQDLAAHIHGDLARQIAVRDSGGHLAMLRTWPVRFDAIEFTESVRSFQTPRRPSLGLPPSFPSVPDFARHARHFAAKRVELIHHRVDGVLQLRDLAATSTVIFARQIAVRNGRRHFAMLRTWP
jgi:hypothetical protein